MAMDPVEQELIVEVERTFAVGNPVAYEFQLPHRIGAYNFGMQKVMEDASRSDSEEYMIRVLVDFP